MTFLKKHLLGAAIFTLVLVSLSLYLFLVRPVVVKRQEVIDLTKQKVAQLQKYADNPPSPGMIAKLTKEKELLKEQYAKVIKTLDFDRLVSLPGETGQLNLYFEEQLEKVGNDLRSLKGMTAIEIPPRLGFKREKPGSKKELSMLLSQLMTAKELLTLVAKSGVSNLDTFNPLPFSLEGAKSNMGGMGVVVSLSGDTSSQRLLEELNFELGVRASISTLTNLLYQLANRSPFFTVKSLEIKSVVSGREASPRSRGGRLRQGRRAVSIGKQSLERGKREDEKKELEVNLLLSVWLFPSNEG